MDHNGGQVLSDAGGCGGWKHEDCPGLGARSASMCSSQTMLEACITSSGTRLSPSGSHQRQGDECGRGGMADDCSDAYCASSVEVTGQDGAEAATNHLDQPRTLSLPSRYQACVDMIRHHKLAEAPVARAIAALAHGGVLDNGSRMIVVSWMVEVAEEFGLQQETLHAAVSLLDRFLSTSNQGVPRCVLQLVAVGCIFLASKQLEVTHPSVQQLVAVAAHSFSAADLLRVERILLDALEFNMTGPTAYAFLHLLTQATISLAASDLAAQAGAGGSPLAEAAAAAAAGGRMEVVVSLAMYLTELALLDAACLAYPGSHLATAALLLAHATLAADCKAWPGVLAAAGLTEGDVAPALAVLSRLHVAALLPPSSQLAELLMPLKVKFGQDCWCQVAAGVTPLSLQRSGAPVGGGGAAAAAAGMVL